MTLDYKKRRYLKNNVLYTILKYYDKIDFSKIAENDILAYRHLLCNLIALKTDQIERKIEKNELK